MSTLRSNNIANGNVKSEEVISVPARTWNLISWLHSQGRSCSSVSDLIKGITAELRRNGVPVDRFFLATACIHNQVSAWIYKWESSAPETIAEWPLSVERFERRQETDKDGPLQQLEFDRPTVRIKASDERIPDGSKDLFHDLGYVDMYGQRYMAMGEFGGGFTWTTKQATGFTDGDIELFETILPAFSTILQLLLKDLTMQILLQMYLGNDPGERVHRGSVSRGDGVTMRSVIWFSDIRGFTHLSTLLDRDTVISLINDVFETTEVVIREHGGEVLKFMGDGLMGVFPVEGGDERRKRSICRIAREAAQVFQSRMGAMRERRSREGLPVVDVGVGLHYGDVSYGNIGAPNRLDFTVIGPAVNLASRVESLCSGLKASVLATDEFVQLDEGGKDAWRTRGKHTLKGVADPVSVFELATVFGSS